MRYGHSVKKQKNVTCIDPGGAGDIYSLTINKFRIEATDDVIMKEVDR